MKIFFDNIVFSMQKSGGVSRYWAEICSRIQKVNSSTNFINHNNSNLYSNLLGLNYKSSSSEIHFNNFFLVNYLFKYLPLTVKIESPAIFHSSMYRYSLQKKVKNIITVHDFISEKYRDGLPKYLRFINKKSALKRASGIVCISENTKKDLLKYFPTIDESRVKVIYHGISNDFKRNKNLKLNSDFSTISKNKYILFVGNRKLYKNFKNAIFAMKRFPKIKFVILGNSTLSKEENFLLKENLKDNYLFLHNPSDRTMNLLYNNALCLLFPSEYEGFGIPVIEASRAGCPVVALNKSSIPELVGSKLLLSKSSSPIDLFEKISMLFNSEIREDQRQIAKNFSNKFTWDKASASLYDFYDYIYQKEK